MSVMGNLLAASAAYKQAKGNIEEAKAMYVRAFEKGVTKPQRITPYGVILMREGRFDEAIELFNKALKMNPKPMMRSNTRINRAIAYTKIGRYDEAKVALEDLHDKFRSVKVYESLGYLYVISGDERAEKYLMESLDYDPENYVILDNLCQYHLQNKDFKKAREYGQKALDAGGEKADVLYHMTLIEAHDKNMEKAVEYCEKMMRLNISGLNDLDEETRLKTYKDITGKDYVPEDDGI